MPTRFVSRLDDGRTDGQRFFPVDFVVRLQATRSKIRVAETWPRSFAAQVFRSSNPSHWGRFVGILRISQLGRRVRPIQRLSRSLFDEKTAARDRRRPIDVPFRYFDFHFDFDFRTRATGNIRTAEAAVGWGIIRAFGARGRTGPTHRERIFDDQLVTCSR